jgi:CRISPR-associated protein Csm2
MNQQLIDWVQNGIQSATVTWAETFARDLASRRVVPAQGRDREKTIKPMSTTQLRKFFGEIKRIQAIGFNTSDAKDDVLMLKPKLAYAVGRDKGETKIKDFYDKMSIALDAIDLQNEKHFKNFVKIFESIVAYHKAAGGE